jgi:Ca2+-binding EF-hand superfamily protein
LYLYSGASTIQGLGRHFKILDDNSDNGISDREFSKALREYGFNISEEEANLLLQLYDKNKDGKIDYEEFLRAVRVN